MPLAVRLAQANRVAAPTLDPRTKMVLLIMINTISFMFTSNMMVMGTVVFIIVALFAVDRLWTLASIFVGITLVSYVLIMLSPHVIPYIGNEVSWVLVFVYMYIPPLAIGVYVVATTTASQLVVACKRMYLPDFVTIPLAVTLRFFPAVMTEMRQVYTAMRLSQGATSTALYNPITVLVHVMLPVIASVLRIGDTLAASALIRGLGSPGPTTSITQGGFTRRDLLGLGCMVLLAASIVLFGQDGGYG